MRKQVRLRRHDGVHIDRRRGIVGRLELRRILLLLLCISESALGTRHSAHLRLSTGDLRPARCAEELLLYGGVLRLKHLFFLAELL